MLLENGITPGSGKPLTHLLMARDHLEALKYTVDLAERKEKLTVDTIQILSGLILKNTGAQYHFIRLRTVTEGYRDWL